MATAPSSPAQSLTSPDDSGADSGADADAACVGGDGSHQPAGDNPEQLQAEIKQLKTLTLSLQGEIKVLQNDAKRGRTFLDVAVIMAGRMDEWKGDPRRKLEASAAAAGDGDADVTHAAATHAKAMQQRRRTLSAAELDALANPPLGVKGETWLATFHEGEKYTAPAWSGVGPPPDEPEPPPQAEAEPNEAVVQKLAEHLDGAGEEDPDDSRGLLDEAKVLNAENKHLLESMLNDFKRENERLTALNRSLRALVQQEQDDNCMLQERWKVDRDASIQRYDALEQKLSTTLADAEDEAAYNEKLLTEKVNGLQEELRDKTEALEAEVTELKHELATLKDHRDNKNTTDAELARLTRALGDLEEKHKLYTEKSERDWVEERIKLKRLALKEKGNGLDTSQVEAALKNYRPHEALLKLSLYYLSRIQGGSGGNSRAGRGETQGGGGSGETDELRQAEAVGGSETGGGGSGRKLRRGNSYRGGGADGAGATAGIAGGFLPALAGGRGGVGGVGGVGEANALNGRNGPRGEGEAFSRWRWRWTGQWRPGDEPPPRPSVTGDLGPDPRSPHVLVPQPPSNPQHRRAAHHPGTQLPGLEGEDLALATADHAHQQPWRVGGGQKHKGSKTAVAGRVNANVLGLAPYVGELGLPSGNAAAVATAASAAGR